MSIPEVTYVKAPTITQESANFVCENRVMKYCRWNSNDLFLHLVRNPWEILDEPPTTATCTSYCNSPLSLSILYKLLA